MGNQVVSSMKIETTWRISSNIPSASGSEEHSKFKIIKKHNKECQDSKLIEEVLVNHFFLQNLEKQARSEIVKEMTYIFIEKNKTLYKQNSIGNYFYILKDGSAEFSVSETNYKKTLKPGDSFGEIELLYSIPRCGTVKTLTDCFLWCIEKKNFNKISEHVVHLNFEDTKKFISSIPLLNNLEHDKKIGICNSAIRCSYPENTTIFRKNEIGNIIYFIKDGEIVIEEENGSVVRNLKKGDYFGEIATMLSNKRTLTAKTKTKCTLYSMSLYQMQTLFINAEGINVLQTKFFSQLLKGAFLKSNFFKKFNVKLLDAALKYFTIKVYTNKDVIYHKDFVPSSKISIIIDGCAVNSKTKEIIGDKLSLLFENELIEDNNKKKIDYDIVALPDAIIIEANTCDIVKHFNSSIAELIDKSSAIERLKKVHLFKNFTGKKLETIAEKIKIDKIKNGDNVITQGEEGTRFFIIKSGKVDIFVNEKYIRTMNENEYLGERALFFKEPRSATAKAKGDVEVFYLEKEDFIQTIEKNLKEFLMNRLYLQDNTVQLSDLVFYDLLGSGSYGSVSLVKSKKNNFFYAIKNISTKQILHEQLHKNLELERSILLQIDHPFIVKLVKTLKDKKYIYFLMEYIKGKELFDVIRDIGLLTKFQTQFYSASMMLAVEYLHERKFIFRDIKPENIMVLDNGYIKVIDFGTAKKIENRAATIIGTPHYMAPEVILGDGYSFQVDYWSIAICMYEFMCGAVPFGENAEEPMDVYLAVINDPLVFPPFVKDKDFKNLMQLMLNKNHLSRYSKIGQISSHVWFQTFNWDDLISMNMQPAFIPTVENKNVNGGKMEYLQFVEKCKEWVPGEGSEPVKKEQEVEFKKWLEHF